MRNDFNHLKLRQTQKIEDSCPLGTEKDVPQQLPQKLEVDSEQDEHASEGPLPLLTVVYLIESSKFGSQTIRNLAGTTPLAHHLKALSDLWQSLGRPDNVFWRSTLVYYNRIAKAPDSDKT